MPRDETIAAIVVTYNRKQLLLDCLNGILSQTNPVDKIFVIENDSPVGTLEYLKNNGLLEQENTSIKMFDIGGVRAESRETELDQRSIQYVRLSINGGGSLGYHVGLKLALDDKYDWMWLMDDDGMPEGKCLESLLLRKHQFSFIAPLVIDNKTRRELSFPLDLGSRTLRMLDEVASLKSQGEEILIGVASPWNGILIKRSVVQNVGLPEKDYFIWGDETEYFFRIRKAGFEAVTVLDALFFHPKTRIDLQPVFHGHLGHIARMNPLGFYCYYRNHYHIYRKYFGIAHTLLWMLKEFVKRLLLLDFANGYLMIRAWKDAFLGVWGKEQQFLKARI